MRSLIMISYGILGLFTICCGKADTSTDRQEDISRLRVFGTLATPLVATLSSTTQSTVSIVVYAAIPTGQTATIIPYNVPTSSRGGRTVAIAASDITVTQPSATDYTAYSGFQLLKATITAKVPLESYFTASSSSTSSSSSSATATNISGSSVFALKVTTSGGDELVTTSEFLVADAANTTVLAYKTPVISGLTPADKAAIPSGNNNISMIYAGASDRMVTVGWFVSGGAVDNRRAQNTIWNPGQTGAYTLVGVAHGATTHGFAINLANVTVQ